MRNRNHRVEIYFTKNELETLTKKVRRSGLSARGSAAVLLNGTGGEGGPARRRACADSGGAPCGESPQSDHEAGQLPSA